jgi:hypothetical protein
MARVDIRLSDESDQDIIAWLDAQDNKTVAVKRAIRTVIDDPSSEEPATVDLSAIRAVFEAVLDERLSGLTLGIAGQSPQGEDSEAAAKLDAMF